MLRELQLSFVEAIHHNNAPSDLPICAKPGLSPSELLAIYRDSSKQGLINTLHTIFSVCRNIVGAKEFDNMSTRYVDTHLSVSPNVNDYGGDFAQWLQNNHRNQVKWPYLSKMAELEWVCHTISRAPLLKPMLDYSLIEFALQNDKDIAFEMLPSMTTFETNYPLYDLWQSNQAQYKGTKKVVFSGRKKEHLIILRDASNLCLYRVEKAIWVVANAMKNGKTMNMIEDYSNEGGVTIDFAAILPVILQENWVRAFRVSAPRA